MRMVDRLAPLPLLAVAVAVLGAGCKDADGKQDPPPLQPAAVVPHAGSAAAATGSAGTPAVETKKVDSQKGDQQDSEWVPAEFKVGQARWKDAGVYVDGKPVGFLRFGELPIALEPTWIKDRVSDRKRPGTNDPGWRWARQRMYKFLDYFKAIGLDVRTIKEVHVYGPRLTNTLIVTQQDLRSPKAQGFMFRFGANTAGKPIAVTDGAYGNGRVADKVAGVMIYVKKTPPTLDPDVGLMLDGVEQRGVPYYGEPIRGGVRIYLDDKLAAIIKRQELDPKQATKGADGSLWWKLADVFAANGVDTRKVVEGWVIREELRKEKLPAAELAKLSFTASPQARGGILLGDGKVVANALALHTRPIKSEELPVITPDDE